MRWDEGKEIEEENPLRQQENQERGERKKMKKDCCSNCCYDLQVRIENLSLNLARG